MNSQDHSQRIVEPLGRREWLISSLLACGSVATIHQAQTLASCLPLDAIDQDNQDSPAAKELSENAEAHSTDSSHPKLLILWIFVPLWLVGVTPCVYHMSVVQEGNDGHQQADCTDCKSPIGHVVHYFFLFLGFTFSRNF